MANFRQSLIKTLEHEGWYSNHPNDRGGETYRGIARKRWLNWPGWAIIDNEKVKPGFELEMRRNTELNAMVEQFYRENFWNEIQGDALRSQLLADELFDTAVNMGTRQAVKFLQRALNLFNRNGTIYPDIKVDGVSGEKTLHCLDEFMKRDSDILLIKALNTLQGCFYISLMETDPSQEAFARGWFTRT